MSDDDPQYREDPREVGYDVAAYEAAGVARVEQGEQSECCENGCACWDEENEDEDGYHLNSDDCDHCPRCCSCVPCMYATVA